jgi:hypothetical protein
MTTNIVMTCIPFGCGHKRDGSLCVIVESLSLSFFSFVLSMFLDYPMTSSICCRGFSPVLLSFFFAHGRFLDEIRTFQPSEGFFQFSLYECSRLLPNKGVRGGGCESTSNKHLPRCFIKEDSNPKHSRWGQRWAVHENVIPRGPRPRGARVFGVARPPVKSATGLDP